MFLKKMEIFGFKSFAEKATIEFARGASAIIGPNGCGKSNIIDAIRWTLGEQSARTLRGGRMEDIIFSGSEKRKPLNFAEVSLRFEEADTLLNCNYSEMEITRRLYRSGESEYFINKTPCRLKDINELFMDTGIGKEVYSIVGQNRVEEIITAKPEERRELIEEAAGILKYKHRKREAQKRLNDMKSNQQRVCDLIYELENQMEPLKEQAAIARKYKELKSRMKENERLIMNYRLGINKKETDKVTGRLNDVKEDTVIVISRLTKTVKALEDLQKKQDETAEESKNLERIFNKYLQEKEQIEGRVLLLEEKERNTLKQQKDNDETMNNLRNRYGELLGSNEKRKKEIEEKDGLLNKIKEKTEVLKKKSESFKNDDSLLLTEDIQKELTSVTSRRESLYSTLKELNHRKKELAEQKSGAEKQKEAEKKKAASIEEKMIYLDSQKEKKILLNKKLHAEAEEHSTALEKYMEEANRLKKRKDTLKEEVSSVENKLWLLKKLEDDKTLPEAGAEELLGSGFSSDGGVLGSVFSAIKVKPKYREAVKAALGDRIFGVLASDEEVALKAVEHLKNKQKGWTTVFPVNLIKKLHKERHYNIEPLKKIRGYNGPALDFAEVEAAYNDVAEWLLKDVFITENLKAALAVASQTNYSVYAVTTEGDAVYPGGLIRGGKKDKQKPLHWDREEEKKRLETLLKEYRNKTQRAEGEAEELKKQQTDCENKIKQIKNQEEQVRKEIDGNEREKGLLSREGEYLKAGIEKLDRTINTLSEEIHVVGERINGIKQDIEVIDGKKPALSEKLESLKDKYRHLLEERDKTTDMLAAQHIEYNRINEQKNYLMESIRQTVNELAVTEEEISKRKEKEKEFKTVLADLETNKKDELIKKDYLARDSKENSVEYEKVKKDYNDLLARKTELEKEEQDLKKSSHRLEKRGHRLELEKTRLLSEREHHINLFKDKFGAAPDGEIITDLNEAEITEQVDKIKEEIEEMGHVRVGAIEELDRLTERVTFLQSQEEDLKKGEESLKEILNEIDGKIKNQFLNAMEEIRSNFKKTYVELFGGGQAIIRFTDPDNILESGIEIDAQPPGKNLKNISLLSSGEKALTAIALVFAIFRYKPAPFYFLDEIESSLDDSNLDRFNVFLDEASGNSQFILITHRRKTMEKANLVYGVTMPESGISRIISMKLKQKAS